MALFGFFFFNLLTVLNFYLGYIKAGTTKRFKLSYRLKEIFYLKLQNLDSSEARSLTRQYWTDFLQFSWHPSRLWGFQLATRTAFALNRWPKKLFRSLLQGKVKSFSAYFYYVHVNCHFIREKKHLLLQLLYQREISPRTHLCYRNSSQTQKVTFS